MPSISLSEVTQLVVAILLLVIVGELLRNQADVPEWLIWSIGIVMTYLFGKSRTG